MECSGTSLEAENNELRQVGMRQNEVKTRHQVRAIV
jgi:hypothetical protein